MIPSTPMKRVSRPTRMPLSASRTNAKPSEKTPSWRSSSDGDDDRRLQHVAGGGGGLVRRRPANDDASIVTATACTTPDTATSTAPATVAYTTPRGSSGRRAFTER